MMRVLPSSRCRSGCSSRRRPTFPLSALALLHSSVMGRREPAFFMPLHSSHHINQRSSEFKRYKRLHPHPTTSTRQKSSVDGDNSDDDSNGGLYLDEETYLQAEDNLLRSDGSLNLNEPLDRQGSRTATTTSYHPPIQRMKNKTYQSAVEGLFSTPPSYSYTNDNDDKEITSGIKPQLSASQQELSDEERLYQTVKDIESGKNAQPTIDPETLHDQVFAEEQTYLEQSEEFRKSLSSLHNADEESPMARERREVNEQYNERVLDDLMKGMDQMEEMAMTREEAMRHAKETEQLSADNKTKNVVFCSGCGLRVTPDMIERAEMIEIANGGGVKKSDNVAPRILCQACYGEQFRGTPEAKVRLGAGSYGGYSSARMFDKKNTRQWAKGEGNGSRKRSSAGAGRNYGKSGIKGIDTSSLFEVPKGYDVESRRSLTMPEKSNNSNKPSDDESQRSPPRRSPPPRRTSRMLGGRELEKRMQQQDSESNGDDLNAQNAGRVEVKSSRTDNLSEKGSLTENNDVSATDIRDEKPMQDDDTDADQWVKVEDPGTKRTLFWNAETGEMKKTLD